MKCTRVQRALSADADDYDDVLFALQCQISQSRGCLQEMMP